MRAIQPIYFFSRKNVLKQTQWRFGRSIHILWRKILFFVNVDVVVFESLPFETFIETVLISIWKSTGLSMANGNWWSLNYNALIRAHLSNINQSHKIILFNCNCWDWLLFNLRIMLNKCAQPLSATHFEGTLLRTFDWFYNINLIIHLVTVFFPVVSSLALNHTFSVFVYFFGNKFE